MSHHFKSKITNTSYANGLFTVLKCLLHYLCNFFFQDNSSLQFYELQLFQAFCPKFIQTSLHTMEVMENKICWRNDQLSHQSFYCTCYVVCSMPLDHSLKIPCRRTGITPQNFCCSVLLFKTHSTCINVKLELHSKAVFFL